MGLKLCVRPGDHGTTVWVSGDIDVNVADPLQDQLLEIMRAHHPQLLLDLSGVSFMDCAGLRALLTTRQRAQMRHGSIRLIAESAAVRRIIDLTMVRDAFPVQRHADQPGFFSSRAWWGAGLARHRRLTVRPGDGSVVATGASLVRSVREIRSCSAEHTDLT